MVLMGISRSDTPETADSCAGKLLALRIFPDEAGKMNRSVVEAGGALLGSFSIYSIRRLP